MSSKLVVTLQSGEQETFDLINSNYSYTYEQWSYRVDDNLLVIWQGSRKTVFPLSSVLKWEVSS